ncbi:MAG: RNA methyltransferase [Anaerolineaceae bacterium]|nr:RNA methyltransferase [Anaerolineaceae bacterium]
MITSSSNPKIKFIRKLRNKKIRDANNLFYIEGPRIISEALPANWKFKQVFFSKPLINDGFGMELLEKLTTMNIECLEVDKDVFESFSIKDGPKGLAAILCQKTSKLSELNDQSGLWVGLDRTQDPGNLGSILRTLDSVGGTGLILIDQCTDPFDISAIRASMGAIFSQKIIKTNSETFINYIKENHIQVIGTSDRATQDYQEVNYSTNMVLLMGSEREGLSEPLFRVCDKLVRIPMIGKSDSLNLAIATSICLYEVFNQNRK